jgi:tetratricopeptide (TPR) repeat protein
MSIRYLLAVLFVLAISILTGCASRQGDDGKIPITTMSDEARKEYLAGRDYFEKLRVQNSIQHSTRATELDPNFAMAYLQLAQAAITANDFFTYTQKAVELSDKVSEGERLTILAFQAGANTDLPRQKELLDQLISKYPKDERAHFALGAYYFGQQQYEETVREFKSSITIDSNYTPAYNLLGYALRFMEKFDDAEKAFRKYAQLIPNDPNPPDSYAELLLKVGRFDESIAQYRRALTIDPKFVNSYVGISANYTYKNDPVSAMAVLDEFEKVAQNSGQIRFANFARVLVDVDGGKMNEALAGLDKQYLVAEKDHDVANMAADVATKANILYEMGGKNKEAIALYEQSLKQIEESDLSGPVKANARLAHHFNLASVAISAKDLVTAKKDAAIFKTGAEGIKNQAQIWQAHQLLGLIALAEKRYDDAVTELKLANQQNPYTLYRLGLAYQGKKDVQSAREFFAKAAHFNSLPALNYAFVRVKALNALKSIM